jgi:hypothetical protein
MVDIIDIHVDDRPYNRSDWLAFCLTAAFLIVWYVGILCLLGYALWFPVLTGDYTPEDMRRCLLLSVVALPASLAFILWLARQLSVNGARLSVRFDRSSREAVFEWRPIFGPVREKRVHLRKCMIVVMRDEKGVDGPDTLVIEAQLPERPWVLKSIATFSLSEWLVVRKIVVGLNAEVRSRKSNRTMTGCTDLNSADSTESCRSAASKRHYPAG